MREFSATDLGNKTGDVLAAAWQEPVTITRHGKARFIMLTTDTYNRIQRSLDPRIARRTADMPANEGAVLEAELTRMIEEGE